MSQGFSGSRSLVGVSISKLVSDILYGRVILDSGTYEAESCLVSEINSDPSSYNNAISMITPNGVKASKLYSLKPIGGAADLTWTRNTTSTRVNSSGLIEVVSNNVPRLDYTNVNCPCILVEPQRTNLVSYSQEFDNAAWTLFNASISANIVSAPDGNVTADKLIENNATSTHRIYTSVSYVSNNTVSSSIYVKSDNRNFRLNMSDNVTGDAYSDFDLTNGDIIAAGSTGSWSSVSSSIVSFGDGWYRCELTATKGAGIIIVVDLWALKPLATRTYTGDGVSGLYFWGAQLETGSTASSYIPTTSGAVTRNADVGTVTTPVGVTSIIETFEDGSTNSVNPIPVTYQMSEGRISKVVMS